MGSVLDHLSSIDMATTCVGVISLLIIVFWPKVNKKIPGSLIALIIATVAVYVFKLPVETIGSRFGTISNRIAPIDLGTMDVSVERIQGLIHPALTIAFLASIESLLSAVVADGMIGKKHQSNMELIAQGIANIGSALFGGIPATGAIARTAANIKNGGRTPIAGIVHAIVVLLIMLVFMPLARLIPMTTLSAILFVVAYNMSEWRSFKALLGSTKSDAAVLVLTFGMTVVFDLVIAIEIGMILAMFLFVRRMSENTQYTKISHHYEDTHTSYDEDHIGLNNRIMVYEIAGPLFFGMANTFLEVQHEVKSHTDVLILKLEDVPMMDATAYQSLKRVADRCKQEEVLLLLASVNEQPYKVLKTTGYLNQSNQPCCFDTVEEAIHYADNQLIQR